eukprot:6171957-Pleurochrysis_carterae.AAC.6
MRSRYNTPYIQSAVTGEGRTDTAARFTRRRDHSLSTAEAAFSGRYLLQLANRDIDRHVTNARRALRLAVDARDYLWRRTQVYEVRCVGMNIPCAADVNYKSNAAPASAAKCRGHVQLGPRTAASCGVDVCAGVYCGPAGAHGKCVSGTCKADEERAVCAPQSRAGREQRNSSATAREETKRGSDRRVVREARHTAPRWPPRSTRVWPRFARAVNMRRRRAGG